jgi:hypothetical protein
MADEKHISTSWQVKEDMLYGYYSVRLRKNVLSLANMQKRTYVYVHRIYVVYL